jgi:hypothetical protein
MARKVKHDQRSEPPGFVCELCQVGVCERCIDSARMLAFYGVNTKRLCQCKRAAHAEKVLDRWEGRTMTETATVTEVTDDISTESSAPAYRYRDAKFAVIWQTSVPRDDEAALAYFHAVCRFVKGGSMPVYCEAIERGEDGLGPETYRMLGEIFDPEMRSTKPFSL